MRIHVSNCSSSLFLVSSPGDSEKGRARLNRLRLPLADRREPRESARRHGGLCHQAGRRGGDILAERRFRTLPHRGAQGPGKSPHMYTCICIRPYMAPMHGTQRFVFPSLPISSCLFLYVPISPYLFLSLPISSYMFLSLPISSYMFLSLPISPYLSLSLPMSSYVFLSLPIHPPGCFSLSRSSPPCSRRR